MIRPIEPGDRVRVTRFFGPYLRESYNATVVCWTKGGRLRVKDDAGVMKIVTADNVKRIK